MLSWIDWTGWRTLTTSTIKRAPEYAGVYHIALVNGVVDYKWGPSQTVYYGMGYIWDRLYKHHRGRGSKVLAKLLDSGVPLQVRWGPSDDPRGHECSLIGEFVDDFGERPLGNINGCRISTLLDRVEDDDY